MTKIRVGVAGASGYGGGELLRLLHGHPQVDVVACVAGTQSGAAVAEVWPSLTGFFDGDFAAADWQRLGRECDFVFLALPHGLAMAAVPTLLDEGARVVDLGADFRLEDVTLYDRWYQLEHSAPQLLGEAAYGMPELEREVIRTARLVANPGCYPTAAGLALLPVAPLVAGGTVVVDAKSGVSGSGRKASRAMLFGEVNENVRAYNVTSHRHTPEIEQILAAAGGNARALFTPHLIPMTRGILASCYIPLAGALAECSDEQLGALFHERYDSEPFVRLLQEPSLPQTKATAGSNFCDLAWRVDRERATLIVITAIDNLGKGAAGQALHNFNLMAGLAETEGLRGAPLYP